MCDIAFIMTPYNQKKIDYTNLYTSYITYASGNYSNTDNAGVFQLNVNNSASNSNANITAHLKFSMLSLPLNESSEEFDIN